MESRGGEGHPRFELTGHRGARGLFPENTIPGFLGALDLGVTSLELDVHVSRDGQVVVIHDPWVVVEGRRVAVHELDVRDLVSIDVGSKPDPDFPGRPGCRATIPTLRQVMDTVRESGRSPGWYIEVKSTPAGDGVLHPPPDRFARIVAESLSDTGPCNAISFDPRILVSLREVAPDLPLQLLIEEDSRLPVDEHLARMGFLPEGIGPHWSLVNERLVIWAHERGLRVHPWTVNDPSVIEHMIRSGVDALTTDRPDVAAAVTRRMLGGRS